jgi:hypothetical protein
MTKVSWHPYTFRVWRGEPLDATPAQVALSRAEVADFIDGCVADAFQNSKQFDTDLQTILMRTLELERVNSVELVDGKGMGTCLHKDWP